MAYKFHKYAELTWSYSRAKMLSECERKYFFHYYGANNGWNSFSSKEAQRLYRLKNLKPMNALFGEVFHKTVQYAIMNYNSESISPAKFKEKLYKDLASKYRESLYCYKDWIRNPNKLTMVTELYYDHGLSAKQSEDIAMKIEKCSENIFNSKSFNEAVGGKVKVKEMEDLQHFQFQEIKAYVKLDSLLEIRGRDKWVVVDWKTSSKPLLEDEEQMLFYTYYVSKKYDVEPKKIESRLEYILQDSLKVYNFSKKDFEFVEAKLSNDLKVMKTYLIDEEENIPKPEGTFKQKKSRVKCSRCNYKEVCYESEQSMDSYNYKVVGIGK
ncbi:MAG: PD-(D/E)XK nuclease family protein [Epulopiscium sp.]|nr:PD-(D/E)XK nuclease family protein [Candidatus Epulonipiscium sp.]